MFGFDLGKKEVMVEAIEEGRIVKVTESYAKKEGLLVLRKEHQINPNVVKPETQGGFVTKNERKGLLRFEEFRRPLRGGNNTANELVENFQWVINQRRREKSLTRKQMATAIGISEYELKMLETGILINDDFVLISKVEKYLGISLRRDGKDYNRSPMEGLRFNRPPVKVDSREVKEFKVDENKDLDGESISGEEIDLDEE